ncbi:phospholipid-transporting ATPase ABCA3-like [Pectinophora gossypiella]|uniref:phospholipid-transporting ATPase ABCA3-like n=1 Tax=Pectinophora gossypiella TaxID=13191 RepID=UPI00214EFC41|nr:phospholipid-transporting ATPase ABCA3-like [Pectinophora gossypiella]
MGAFKVLMWKHYVVRKRRFIQTFVEFMTPISLVLGIFVLKDPMQRKTETDLGTELPVSSFSLESTNPPTGILYTPDSEASHRLMEEVTHILSENNSTGYPRLHVRSLAFPHVALAVEALFLVGSKSKEVLAMVEFENMTGRKLPDMLKYTIRMKALLSRRPNVKFQRLFEKFENVPQSFLPLQWAIDSSYMKLKSNSGRIMQKIFFEPLSEVPLKAKLNKTFVSTVFYLLTYVSFGAPMLPFVFLMNRLLEERATGIQELVKMVGVTPTMLGITHFLNSLPPCLIYCFGSILLMKATDTPMVPASNVVILFIGQFLHFMSMIAMAYACSHISGDDQHTVSLALFSYIGMWIPIRLLGHSSKSDIFLFFHGLCPHCPSYWFLNEGLVSEVRHETGLQFSTIHVRQTIYQDGSRNASVLVSFIMQLIQISYMYLISWFLEKVRPGKYGIALPWNFFLQKEYWSGKFYKPPEVVSDTTAPYDPDYQKYFEYSPKNMLASIQIKNVSKIFESGDKRFQALNNVTLEIYKGEITVLLGHNGAGKTTLISIITGMINPTSGKIYVNGMDTVTRQADVRKQLGFCPQHNLFFPDLTVLEHLMFFSLIKGGTFEEARLSSYSLMEQLDLVAHAGKKTTQLSGGLLRRLQLGCALCGNANVLILDEPTSGLDVEARRELWDMLLSLRGDRALVLTTHFMEEADVLGDRIAALHLGKLRCHATPMFLKKAVGSGFRVNITTVQEPDVEKISRLLKEMDERVVLNDRSMNTLTYTLPAEVHLPTIFKTLETSKQALDIECLGIGVTTLEEVFLELCCDVDTSARREVNGSETPPVFTRVTGSQLILRQTKALFKRQFDYTMAKKYAFVILHIIMPFVLCTSLTQIFNILDSERNKDLSLNLDMYSETGLNKAIYNIRSRGTEKVMATFKYTYPFYTFTNIKDMPFVHSLNLASKIVGRTVWNEYAVGIAINDTSAIVFYMPGLKHSIPVGLNLLSNVLSNQKLPSSHGKTIVTMITNNWPVLSKPYHVPKTKINCSLFAIFNICTLVATTISDLTLPCKERLTVARHIHIMAGCSPLLYWLVTFLYHMAGYVCFCCTATLVAAAFFDNDRTLDDKGALVAIFVVVTLSGMNTYAFMYFISFCFTERTASLLLVGFVTVFGFLTPILILALEDLKTSSEETVYKKIMNRVGLFIPAYMFTKALIEVTDVARFNSFCSNNIHKCPNLVYYSEGFDSNICCSKGTETEGPFKYFAFSDYAAGQSIVVIALQVISFSVLVLLMEYGVFNYLWNVLGNNVCKSTYPHKRFYCPNVKEETAYVTKSFERVKPGRYGILLVDKAWKVYRGLCGRQTFAVKGESFAIKKGECFGILGLNGAGKTTTFKLISREESLTSGKIFVAGHYSKTHNAQYLRSMGYCPQFCGLDDFRSGNANIRLLLILRGLKEEDVKRETAAWLEVVGMTKHAHRKVCGYSGGMVRRLATASALCGDAPLSLLDEPTAGVDTAARRLVWAALQRGLSHGRAIAMSSHCMDEMERLCKRVTILSVGEMSVLGTPQALKEKYASGHSIVFKLHADVVQSLTGPDRVLHLQRTVERTFNCSMKDRHLTSLHYRIHEKMMYSDIFDRMEAVMSEFNDLIEDYSVSDTTLEDVFLQFAADGDRTPPMSRNSSAKAERATQSTMNYNLDR